MQRTFNTLKTMALVATIAASLVSTAGKAEAQGRHMVSASMAPAFHPAPQFLHYDGRYAKAPIGVPPAIFRAVMAANELQGKPYKWGGGHRSLNDNGYDCSGSVSYILFKAGLIRGPMTSQGFRKIGQPGPGRWITLYVSHNHVFVSICGLRFDTSDYGANRGDGPKWRPTARKFPGFEVRHLPGL